MDRSRLRGFGEHRNATRGRGRGQGGRAVPIDAATLRCKLRGYHYLPGRVRCLAGAPFRCECGWYPVEVFHG